MTGPEFLEVNLESGTAEQVFKTLVSQADQLHASDLFFLTNEKSITVSVRQWGQQKHLAEVSLAKGNQLINYIKTAADMDIAEKRRPLDGRLIQQIPGKKIDMRVNCLPTLYGEDLSLRLMDREMSLKPLDDLGMQRRDLDQLKSMLESPSGLILVTGPTGTGKTTTLYACLQYLNDGHRKINTLEDPIEYAVQGFRQSQVHPKIGLDFPELLRNVLRQAPDVIMIGEIRDEETASTAVRAANSGHLVFATLHAALAAGAINSMLTRGSHPNFLSSCLLGVVAQRLVRQLCPNCRGEYDLTDAGNVYDEVRSLIQADQGNAFYGPEGCEKCFGDGYVGRTGVFEVLNVNRQMRELIAAGRSTQELHQAAIENGMIEFRRAAILKVAQGITSMEEVLATVPVEHLGIDA